MASPPSPLALGNSPTKLAHHQLNVAFMFGVEQGEKLRACDDLRHARKNLACVLGTPINLANWDHVAQLSNLVNAGSRDWAFFKADHEAAYKQLPLDAEKAKLAVAALRSPVDNRRYCFISRTMVFGAVAEVLRYNVSPSLISELFTQLFGIPLLVFFGDFGAITPCGISEAAIRTFALFCSKLGIKLKTEKSEAGRRITFLGLEGDFPCRANGFALSVCLTREKAEAWDVQLSSYIKAGCVSSNESGKLIGKLGFSQTNLFGKFARSQVISLYVKFYARPYFAALSQDGRSLSQWRIGILKSLQPRIHRRNLAKPDIIVYTDAALLSRRIACLIMPSSQEGPATLLLAEAANPKLRLSKFNKKNPIIGLEILAPLALLRILKAFQIEEDQSIH